MQAGRYVSVVPANRPRYVYQVPLEFIPGIGKKTLDRLLLRFGTEMSILHDVPEAELAETAGEAAAAAIVSARFGELRLQAGGGGEYGKVVRQPLDEQDS